MYWIMPMALFYSGFFAGPFFTLIIAALATKLKLEARLGLFLIGAAGTTWCILQAITVLYSSTSLPMTIHIARSVLNLVFGAISFRIVQQWGQKEGYFSGKKTHIITICVGVISGILFLFPPSKIMMAIGR